MDIDIIEKNLNDNYNCQFITFILYQNSNFVKALERTNKEIKYRYFKVMNDNGLKEIEDEEILRYFRFMYEIKSDVFY